MAVKTLLTEDEFLNLPESAGRQEFRDGELIEVPPAKFPHSELIKRIYNLLLTALHESRVWTETAFRLRKGRWIVPDVCVIWPDHPREEGYLVGSPMVAIEIASRGNTPDELQEKVTDYLQHGVGEVLVIYPKTRTMIVYRPNETLNIAGGEEYRCDLANGVVFTPQYRTEID